MSDNDNMQVTLLALETELRAAFAEAGRPTSASEERAIFRHTRFVARAVYVHVYHERLGYGPRGLIESKAREEFPLPPRKVLREEPVPQQVYAHPRYRVVDGVAQVQDGPSTRWRAVDGIGNAAFDLMRHLLDLHDNPERDVPE